MEISIEIDGDTFWILFFLICGSYYTIKNYLAYKRGKDF